MKKLYVVASLVGILVFVVAFVGAYYLINPDTTPRTLAGQAWLPGPPQSSQLLVERNLQKQKVKIPTVSLANFKAMELTMRDVVLDVGGYKSLGSLEYYGQKPDGDFVVASVGVVDLFPRRPAIYQTDWQTLTFDRQTGAVSVVSGFDTVGLGAPLFVFALLLAASFALTTPEKPSELVFWLGFMVVGALNVFMFWVWQWGKVGFVTEPAIWAAFVGVASCWCFFALWLFTADEPGGLIGAVSLSLIFLGIGVLLESAATVMLFQAQADLTDWLVLAGLYSVPAILTDLVAYWLVVNDHTTQPAPPPTKKEARARMNQHAIMMD